MALSWMGRATWLGTEGGFKEPRASVLQPEELNSANIQQAWERAPGSDEIIASADIMTAPGRALNRGPS